MPRLSIIWIGLLLGALGVSSNVYAAGPIEAVATLTDLGKIAEAIGGDRVHVTTIASGVQDPHFIDPKPSYMVKLRDADLFFVNGLDLEIGWVPPLLEGARNARIRAGSPGYVDCSKNILVLEVPGPSASRAEGDVHPFGNPHYLTDPLNYKIVGDTMAAAFQSVRPGDAEYFAARNKAFRASIDRAMFGDQLVELVGGNKLDRLARSGELMSFLQSERRDGASLTSLLGGWMSKMSGLRGQSVVFYHRSYSYFAQRFGLNVIDYLELKPGIQPGPSHLADVIEEIRRDKVGIIAAHPFQNQKIARLVAEKSGARLVMVPLTVGGVPAATNAVTFFDSVIGALLRATEKP